MPWHRFSNREMSGAFTANRPGFQSLMRAAELKSFNIIVAEDMDRVFRSQRIITTRAGGSTSSASACTPSRARSAKWTARCDGQPQRFGDHDIAWVTGYADSRHCEWRHLSR